MSYLRRFGQFWWEFVVGDNLPLALGAGATIAVTALLVDQGVNAWWLLPMSILGLLAASVAHDRRSGQPGLVVPPVARRGRDEARSRGVCRGTADERIVHTRAPETLGADTRTARFIGEASMRDVERLAD